MELEHEFTVPVPKAQAWAVLMDVERIAPCMPGATFDGYEGDGFKGRVKVKLGPITVTYGGTARFAERDEDAGKAVIEAAGKESRGPGTASATIHAQMYEAGATTRIKVVTDLNVTGKPAQFGRGVMAEVGAKLVGQFADCLATQLGSAAVAPGAPPVNEAATEAAAEVDGSGATASTSAPESEVPEVPAVPAVSAVSAVPPYVPAPGPRPTSDAIDLMETAAVPVLKRVLPVLAAAFALFLVWRLIRRRR